MNIGKLIHNKRFRKILPKLYGFGASVVILGALFKIQHWTGAGFMLSAGLITEAIIFIIYAFDTEEESGQVSSEGDVTSDGASIAYGEKNDVVVEEAGSSAALAKFDEMLVKADITPDLFMNLGAGMRKLGESAININSMGDISGASIKYMNTIRVADESLEKLAKTYQNTIIKVIDKTEIKYRNIAESISVIESGTKSYQQQIEILSNNISALNAVYKLQRKGTEEYLKDLAESAADTKKYREQITKLNDNLSALNSVYGNMLAAMKVK
jgi:gliding motility-associated protein GldL